MRPPSMIKTQNNTNPYGVLAQLFPSDLLWEIFQRWCKAEISPKEDNNPHSLVYIKHGLFFTAERTQNNK
jgi:hypothetical protein